MYYALRSLYQPPCTCAIPNPANSSLQRWDAGLVCHPVGWDGWSVTVLWQVQEITVVTSKCLHWGSLQMADLELIFHRKHKWSHCNKEHQMLGVVDTTLALRAMVKSPGNEENLRSTCFRTLISNDHVLRELSKSWEKAKCLLIKIFNFSSYSTQYTQTEPFLKKETSFLKRNPQIWDKEHSPVTQTWNTNRWWREH